MACVQWVYANGSCWAPLDRIAQNDIEVLWSCNYSNWIRFPSVSRTGVYVDFQKMVMLCNGYAYTIARLQWVYSNGSYWAPLNRTAQNEIEVLWSNNYSNWNQFRFVSKTGVYIDFQKIVMLCNGLAYTIACCILL